MKITNYLLIFLFLFFSYQFNYSVVSAKEREKVIYLTFDDAPSNLVTPAILDILKRYNIKATFFLVGNELEGNEDVVLRIFLEGHSIGLHSFSHKITIFKTNKTFLQEMLVTQEMLFRLTGEKTVILRFPYGTNNIYYRISDSMVDLLHQHGFKIYDWTLDSLDGNPKNSPNFIIKRSISKDDYIILLLHAGKVNKNTIKALPAIIEYYQKKGYKFRVITTETPEYYDSKKVKEFY